jgi:hypothetical protein|tara:strand:- start:2704 stop:2895 length:192 start_codon:yes stop_codon:yes gene_type:complete
MNDNSTSKTSLSHRILRDIRDALAHNPTLDVKVYITQDSLVIDELDSSYGVEADYVIERGSVI